MLISPFEPRHLARLRHVRSLATLAMSVGLLGWASATLAQSPSAAEEAIKKAIQGGQLDQARQLVQKERKNAPQAVQWRFMEGVIQAQQGQIDKAIETFKQITQTHPEHSEAYNNLGVLYASKGQLEASKTYLEKALQTHPSYAAAHRNLSDVHSHLAKQSYAKALQVAPKAKASAPQLTLLGAMGSVGSVESEQRGQAQAPSAAALTPAAAAASAPGPAASQAPKPAASAPTPSPASVAAASAPAATPAAPSANDARPAERAAVEKAVQDWAKAWSDKDIARYYDAYANTFIPANKASRAQWETERRTRIMSNKSISVEVREMQVKVNGETALVRFQQIYSSDNLKGSNRKTLEMVRQGNRWLIARESVN